MEVRKLSVLYNVWIDSVELLKGSIECIKDHVDVIIIIYQRKSNWGEEGDPLPSIYKSIKVVPRRKVILYEYIPDNKSASIHEREKRNEGLRIAKENKCTHFLHMDCDEYYEDFGSAKEEYFKSGAIGSVCQMWTYFKKPTLRFENHEGYFVPFIHELYHDTVAGNNHYPYYVDPTRRVGYETRVIPLAEYNIALLQAKMHHFSWVRKDINIKVRNSTARNNIAKGTAVEDYNNPELGTGFYVRDFQMKLIEVENIFGIDI